VTRPLGRLGAVVLLLGLTSCGENALTGSDPAGQGAQRGGGGAATPRPGAAVGGVRIGIEFLDSEKGGVLKGKKVGLVAHGASIDAEGHHTVDVLKKNGVTVVRLFSPEHGPQGRAAAGQKVESGKDSRTGLPLVSLYGEKNKPSAEDLKELDALVYDLQDAGVRYYTYISTLLLCLEAAADAGIEFVVLDRPNPLGGERVEGPVSDPRDVLPASLVNMAPGPLVHGLTAGEMARYANARREKAAKLTVIPMKGWKRSMVWADTGRTWVAPSPNLRSAEATIAYPGTALIEATNASEGRGTEAPFLLVGAPWADPAALAAVVVPGFTLEATKFTPHAADSAPDPKFKDVECNGVRIKVADARAAKPYTLGVALLGALRKSKEFAWRSEDSLDRLVGTRKLRAALEKDQTVEAIVEADAEAIETFRKERREALIY
jgi:uncharacterized protein YbbC (DUF1343 family)